MAKTRRSSSGAASRPDLVRLRPWVLGSGSLALLLGALHLLGPQSHLPSAAQGAAVLLVALVGALALHWRRRRGDDGPAAALAGLSRREFEARLLAAFRAQGYQPVATGAGGAVDLVLRRDRGNVLVHCRRWQSDKLGIEVVRELHGLVETRGAAGGFVVCAGRFSRTAQRFAAGSTVRLIDGPALALLLAEPSNAV